jgi:hypothetical protein
VAVHDYFRAADTKTALQAMHLPAGPLGPVGGFDGMHAQGVDPYDVLGQLIALIRRVPTWAPNLVQAIDVSPDPATKPMSAAEYEELSEDSPWKTGPWLIELNGSVRDALAMVDDARIPDLAAQWAQIEELGGALSADAAQSLIGDLVALARRTREARNRLYCWTSL